MGTIGDQGVIHQLRGCISHKRLKESVKERVKKLYERKYEGFGPPLASEKLLELDGIKISRESLRKILIDNQLWRRKLKGRKHQLWRERKSYCGQMVQMDGSDHNWLEDRGPRIVLMGYIDDAMGRVYGRFYEYEGTIPAMDSFKRYIQQNGIPQSIYLDKHSAYKVNVRDSLKDIECLDSLSQFERSLKELNVTVIHAHSPAAKGRVERLFRTLQDRLVKEFRLCNVKTIKEANECLEKYLPIFNKKFNVEPVKRANLHRKRPPLNELKEILCTKTMHPLRNDFTIVHDKMLYQVLKWTYAKRVEVRGYLDGSMAILANGYKVKYKRLDKSPKKRVQEKISLNRIRISRNSRKKPSWGTIKPSRSSLLTIS